MIFKTIYNFNNISELYPCLPLLHLANTDDRVHTQHHSTLLGT